MLSVTLYQVTVMSASAHVSKDFLIFLFDGNVIQCEDCFTYFVSLYIEKKQRPRAHVNSFVAVWNRAGNCAESSQFYLLTVTWPEENKHLTRKTMDHLTWRCQQNHLTGETTSVPKGLHWNHQTNSRNRLQTCRQKPLNSTREITSDIDNLMWCSAYVKRKRESCVKMV